MSSRLSRLNRNLLLLAKMENGQFSKAEVDVVSVINELQPYFDNFADGLLLQREFQTGPMTIIANRVLLECLMNNLIVNAVRHNRPNGLISIMLKDGVLAVTNTSDETALDEKMIYNRFYRSSEKLKGYGLGLAIVKAICEYHGWDIKYAYHDGVHSFIVTFS